MLPAIPQPQPTWGLFIANPVWNPRANVAIFDMRSIDGRIFAIQVPSTAPCWILMQLAGIPPGMQANLIVGFDATPVPLHRMVRVLPGQCLTFIPEQRPPAPISTMDNMLRTGDLWGPGPAFSSATQADCYCLATEADHRLLVLDPRRPGAYWALAAAESQIPEPECHLSCMATRTGQ